MKRAGGVLSYSLFMLLLVEVLASCANTNPDLDVEDLWHYQPEPTVDIPDTVQEPLPTHTYQPTHNPIAAGSRYYQVCAGDTLHSIGARSGIEIDSLAKWNNLQHPYRIYVGQKLQLFPLTRPEEMSQRYMLKPLNAPPKSFRIASKERIVSQKKLTLSTDNRKVLKFYCEWPIRGKVLKSFAQSGNKGIDIATEIGHPVKAAAGGEVIYSGQGLLGYGNLLIIKHNEAFLSAYGNNSKLLVKEGQRVEKGGIIAEAGKGPHNKPCLHFEVRKNGKPINPVEYLPNQ